MSGDYQAGEASEIMPGRQLFSGARTQHRHSLLTGNFPRFNREFRARDKSHNPTPDPLSLEGLEQNGNLAVAIQDAPSIFCAKRINTASRTCFTNQVSPCCRFRTNFAILLESSTPISALLDFVRHASC